MDQNNPQNQVNNKTSFMGSLKKHFNYPMVLMLAVAVFTIESLWNTVLALFRYSNVIPNNALSMAISLVGLLAPFVIFTFLWLFRIKKVNASVSRTFITLSIAVFTASRIYSLYRTIRTIKALSPYMSYIKNYRTLYLGPISDSLLILLSLALVVGLFRKSDNHKLFRTVAVIFVILSSCFGIVSLILFGQSNFFLDVIYVLALWYIPAAINDSPSAEITSGKAKFMLVGFIVVISVFAIVTVMTGNVNSPNRINGWEDYDNNGSIDDDEFEEQWQDKMDEWLS